MINRAIRNYFRFIHSTYSQWERHWRISGKAKFLFQTIEIKMHGKCDDSILDSLYYGANYSESPELRLFHLLANGGKKTVFDLGANTGIYSLIRGKGFPEDQIFSFEPNPVNYTRLVDNVKLNALTNVQTFPFAVGATKADLSFYVPKSDIISDTSSTSSQFSNSTYGGQLAWKEIKVSQLTLDSFCTENNLNQVNLMKIDVEGHEIDVLEGAREIIAKSKPIILIESFLNESKTRFLKNFVLENKYMVYLVLGEGIVRTDREFEKNARSNFLLMSYRTENIFTSYEDLMKSVE